MPKPTLKDEAARLESEAIETMFAGLKQWRPDLDYPQSHSDMQACFRALLVCYEIKRRPLPEPLRLKCPTCEGLGHLVTKVDAGCRHLETCRDCTGRGWKI